MRFTTGLVLGRAYTLAHQHREIGAAVAELRELAGREPTVLATAIEQIEQLVDGTPHECEARALTYLRTACGRVPVAA